MGIAILRYGRLHTWETKTFKGSWSEIKYQKLQASVISIIERHNVSRIAMKIPHPSRSSPQLQQLITSINGYCQQHAVLVYVYSIKDLERELPAEKYNLDGLVKWVIFIYPELTRIGAQYSPRSRKGLRYVFEAVAAVHMLKSNLKRQASEYSV